MSALTEFLLDDELDETFFDEVDKLTTQHPPLPPPPPPTKPPSATSFFSPPHPLKPPPPPPQYLSYSPPRQLSQLFSTTTTPLLNNNNNNNINNTNVTNNNNNNTNVNDMTNQATTIRDSRSPVTHHKLEIHKLKSELSRVSKQLCDLKEECSELRKERQKERLQSVHSNTISNACDSEATLVDCPKNGISLKHETVSAKAGCAAVWIETEQKSIGIQTDRGDESVNASISCASSTSSHLPKLMSIWSSRSSHRSQRKFVAKLLETCATDLCLLFGCLGLNMTSKMVKECLTHPPLPGNYEGSHATEVARVSQLYSVLAKLSNDLVHVNTLVEVLLDLCTLENCTLLRDNVQGVRCHSGIDAEHVYDFEVGKSGGVYDIGGDETSSLCTVKHDSIVSLCHVNWFHLFTSVSQIAVKLKVEDARVEAVSIMNAILRGMDPYLERGRYAEMRVFEAAALLLRKEAGLLCQKEAVHLLYLLLNCPRTLATFCSSCKAAEGYTQSSNDGEQSFSIQVSVAVLEGISDCIVCSGYGVKELNLCRNTIVVLAFLASSGKSGIEIFLFHKLSNRASFLGLIFQLLVSEIDTESSESCPAPEISKERTLLIREALILLNRLASHPAHSATVLRVITGCRDMVSLGIDIATRLSKKSRRLLKSDGVTRQMRESEVIDLARLFKKRIFTFLGENSS